MLEHFIQAPLSLALALAAVLAIVCWVLSIVTGNYSQVDRLWSIAPPVYVCLLAAYAGFDDARVDLMALLTIAWGVRLTYNFARKGGYLRGSEDYRWPEIRKVTGPVVFQLFNATFIAPFQNLLLLLLAVPAYAAHGLAEPRPLNALDLLAAGAFAVLLAGETIADQQQWRFQTAKHARKARGQPVEGEFLTDGLFRYSRHPNFFCEQGMWWCFYLFSVAAGAGAINWSIIGAVVLTLLFQGSTTLTERLTLDKYPDYAAYQRRTSRLIPWPPRTVGGASTKWGSP